MLFSRKVEVVSDDDSDGDDEKDNDDSDVSTFLFSKDGKIV